MGVVDHIHRLGDAAQHGYQRNRAQQKAQLVAVVNVAEHVTDRADVADNGRIRQRHLSQRADDAKVEREIAEQRATKDVPKKSSDSTPALLDSGRIRLHWRLHRRRHGGSAHQFIPSWCDTSS